MSRVSNATVAWTEATAFERRHLTNETRPAYSVHLKTGHYLSARGERGAGSSAL
jgi:hypothetical protein